MWLLALAVLTVVRLVLAAVLPLAPDEAYYALWAVHLQPGYFDHPPMVALWIRAGTALAGYNPLGIRLLGPLAAAGGSVLLWRAGEDFFPGRQAGIAAAALLNATLMVGVGAIVMTPDTPLFFFWCVGLAALGRLLRSGDARWWLCIGAAAGLALLSKYTGALFLAAVGSWLLASRPGRAQLRRPWPWAGLAVALLLFAPNIAWNAQHHWVSYLKQGSRVGGFDAARTLQFFGELVVSQVGLATPVIFGLGIGGSWRLRGGGSAASLLLWLLLLPGAVFLEHIVSGRIEANWPAVLYPAACLAAAGLPLTVRRRWLAPALGLGLLCSFVVYAQALAAPFPLPARADPTALQLAGWASLTRQAQRQAAAVRAAYITSDEYGVAAEFTAHAQPGDLPVLGSDPDRWHSFGFTPAAPGSIGLMVTRRRDTACPVQYGTATRQRGAAPITLFKLCRYAARQGSELLP